MNALNTLIESEYSKIEVKLREYILEEEKKIPDITIESDKIINIIYDTKLQKFTIKDTIFWENVDITWVTFESVFELWNTIRNSKIKIREDEANKIKKEIEKIEEFLKNKELYLEIEIVFNKTEPVITHTYAKKYQFIKTLL